MIEIFRYIIIYYNIYIYNYIYIIYIYILYIYIFSMIDQDLNITGTSRASEIVFPRLESRASTPQTHLESAAESASTSEQ